MNWIHNHRSSRLWGPFSTSHSQQLFAAVTPAIIYFLYRTHGKKDKVKLARAARVMGVAAIARLTSRKVQTFFSWVFGTGRAPFTGETYITSQVNLNTAISVFSLFLGEEGLYLASAVFGWNMGFLLSEYVVYGHPVTPSPTVTPLLKKRVGI